MPIHQPFTRLPVWLRRVLTLLAVVLLAALLTHWRQNASTYATGFWDTGSQPLVFGRMLQMENHQSAPGGFMGVYTQEWSDGQNRTWFRENTPVNAEDFQAYTHQSGLQGWAFGLLNRAFRLVQPSGETRETWLYTVNCILFYTAELLLALAGPHGRHRCRGTGRHGRGTGAVVLAGGAVFRHRRRGFCQHDPGCYQPRQRQR